MDIDQVIFWSRSIKTQKLPSLVKDYMAWRTLKKRSFTVMENILRKKTFVSLLWLEMKCYCGKKAGNPERAVSLHLAHAGNQSQRGIGIPIPTARNVSQLRKVCQFTIYNSAEYSFLPARGAFHAMNVSSACVLIGSYDLLKDRRVHDDSARFKFESWVILWTNQNALIRKATNEFASFCVDTRLGQTAIFTILPKWERIRSTRFHVKQANFCVICLYYVRQIDSMLPPIKLW